MANRIGQQLGNYRLVRLLGYGGFAEVYLGEHVRLNTQAAIKVLYTTLREDDAVGFQREAQTIARLKHPHIVRVFDFDVEANTPFLVMEYLPQGNVRRPYPKGTPLPLTTIVSYVKQVASALQYAHNEKIIHRDIKPENMLLDQDSTLMLSDFGIALMAQSSRYQNTQEVAGTATYMAPEQFQGKPHRASDLYSLGIVVYEWLCGDRPFHGTFTEIASQHLFVPPPPLHEKVPTIPPDVEQVVMTALAKDYQQRFSSVQAFANALEQASQVAPPRLVLPSTQSKQPGQPSLPTDKITSPFTASPPTDATRLSDASFVSPIPAREPVTASEHLPAKRSISWRVVVLGLAGLAMAAAIAVAIAWLVVPHSPSYSAGSNSASKPVLLTPLPTPTPTPTLTPTPKPTPTPTSAPTASTTLTSPVLNLPGTISMNATNKQGAAVFYTVTATDAAYPSSQLSISCSPPSGATFPIGTTTVYCSASDPAGNHTNGSFLVLVKATTPTAPPAAPPPVSPGLPVLNLPGTVVAYTYSGGAIVSYDASASDARGNPLPISCSPSSGSTFSLGTTTVTCSAHDSAGTTTGSFQVVVKSQTS